MKDPRIAVLMIVLNEEKYLDLTLTRIYDYADQILIAEGAVKDAIARGWAGPDGRSTDRTLEILKAWSHREKVTVVSEQWAEKSDMGNRLLKEVKPGITHLHIIDPDEFYELAELKLIKQKLPKIDAEVIRIGAVHYGPGGARMTGGELNLFYHRIYRWRPGKRFQEKKINIIVDPQGNIGKEFMWPLFRFRHYGHINPDYANKKVAWYSERQANWKKQ